MDINKTLVAAAAGQQAGCLADITGDGALDMALVLANGQLVVFPRRIDPVAASGALGVQASLPVGSGGDGSTAPIRATAAWRFAPADDGEAAGAITSAAAFVGEAIYVGARTADRTALARLDLSAADAANAAPTVAWLAPTPNAVVQSPVVIDQRVFVVDGVAGEADRAVRCVDAQTGGLLWDAPVAAEASGSLTASSRYLFVADAPRTLTCLSPAGEMELAQPRWREDAGYLHTAIDRYRNSGGTDPQAMHDANRTRREQIDAGLDDRLAEWGGGFLSERIATLVAEAQTLLPYREVGKHYLMMGYELIRAALVELGRRWEIGRDVFFLHLDELPEFEGDRDRLLESVGRRKIRWRSAQRLATTPIVRSEHLDELGVPAPIDAAATFDAVALAPGVAEGPVQVIYSPDQAGELPDRCVLVCPSTDPGWTALFPSIAALIVERGGVLSHGAITARDFGVPAVTCPDATRRFADGAIVRVDGDRGRVDVVREGETS